MSKISAARFGKRVWSAISQIDTIHGLVQWIGGLCLASILASRWWAVNPFLALSWFFGTIFVTVLAVKSLNLLWSKRDQLTWPRSKRNTHGAPSIRVSAVVVTPTQLERERDQALLDLARERDALLKELAGCKRSFGIARLEWLAYLFRSNTEKAKLDGRDLQNVRVTVRFAPPYDDDYFLAEEIKKILEQYTGWPVEIDGTNNPLIRPSDEFRVVFESS